MNTVKDWLENQTDAEVIKDWLEDFKVSVFRPSQKTESKQLITIQQATAVFGRSPSAKQFQDLNDCFVRFHITSFERMRHFLSQIAEESNGLKWVQELSTDDEYEWRQDLSNIKPGDDRTNYQAFANYMGDQKILQGGEYVAAEYPFSLVGFWWMINGMNALVDSGANVETVTLRVNGGQNRLRSRQSYFDKASDLHVGWFLVGKGICVAPLGSVYPANCCYRNKKTNFD